MTHRGPLVSTLIAIVLLPAAAPRAQQSAASAPAQSAPETFVLKPTDHVRLPADASRYWLAPSAAELRLARTPPMTELVEAVRLELDSNFAKALPLLSRKTVEQGVLGDYAMYYKGLAELKTGRPADAKQTFQALAAKPPTGFLVEGVALREAESDEALGDSNAALAIYERLSKTKATQPDDVLMRMGRTAKAANNSEKAVEAYSRVLYEFPFSDLVAAAERELQSLPAPPVVPGGNRYKLELGRAERLFASKRYAAARPIFEALRRAASGDDRELLDLRLAECDYFQKRTRSARDGVRPYLENASRQGEALFFYALATRELGDHAEYVRIVRRIAKEFPDQSWAEEALNNLATQFIIQDDDEDADTTFREMYAKYPMGHYAERAAWKIGWYAYKNKRYADTIHAFESGAAHFPRSDYRPSWLYWAGRAHENLNEQALADERYTLVATDYLNSYYGRLAAARLGTRGGRPPKRPLVVDGQTTEPPAEGEVLAPPPPNERIVRALLALDLYDQAIDELRYAQKNWADTPVIQATYGWIYNQRGELRPGINAMKRAYPQYLAAGGEQMPIELLKVRFPVNYWPLIKKYAALHELDPYMMAALIAQESNFTADIRSSANAYGLMQLLPSTGRQYARTLQISRRFSIGMLTTAETNLRMGSAYLADLVKQFGGVHYALATYNAGPHRVSKWMSERPGIEREEFIDDIPYPETQDYVRKIIGQAEDYRRLYGPGGASASDDEQKRVVASKAASSTKASAAPAKKKPAAKKAPAKRKRRAN